MKSALEIICPASHTLLPPRPWPGTSSQTAHSADVWWFQKAKGSRVMSVNSLQSPLGPCPRRCPSKPSSEPWPHHDHKGFHLYYPFHHFHRGLAQLTNQTKIFLLATHLPRGELEAPGLRGQSWPGHGPAICAVTQRCLHQPPWAVLRGPGTRGRWDQRAQIWCQGQTGRGADLRSCKAGPGNGWAKAICNYSAIMKQNKTCLEEFWRYFMQNDLWNYMMTLKQTNIYELYFLTACDLITTCNLVSQGKRDLGCIPLFVSSFL